MRILSKQRKMFALWIIRAGMGHCKNFAVVKFFLKWAGAEKENFDDH